jgi:hypothetical protein
MNKQNLFNKKIILKISAIIRASSQLLLLLHVLFYNSINYRIIWVKILLVKNNTELGLSFQNLVSSNKKSLGFFFVFCFFFSFKFIGDWTDDDYLQTII